MERTRKTSEELDLEMRRTRGPNKHLERRTAREREREKERKKERKKKKKRRKDRQKERKTERSEGMGDKEVPLTESTQRKNRNGDREVRREVGNRQGDM